MNELVTRLEYGRQLAADATLCGETLASAPTVVFDQRTKPLEERLHIPLDDIIEFTAAEIKVDPSELNSMAICVYDCERDQHGKSPIYRCQTTGEPRSFGNDPELHFPILAVGLELNKSGLPRIGAVNNELRHQIWHLKERQQQSWLLHPVTVGVGRVVCAASSALFSGLTAYSYMKGAVPDIVGNGFGAVVTADVARDRIMHELLEYMSLRELRASGFSIRTSDFEPITSS